MDSDITMNEFISIQINCFVEKVETTEMMLWIWYCNDQVAKANFQTAFKQDKIKTQKYDIVSFGRGGLFLTGSTDF